MAQVIHTRKGKHLYKYEHTREGGKVVSRYMYPVDGKGDEVKPYHERVVQHDINKMNIRTDTKDLDWDKNVLNKKWTKKYGEIVDPDTNEILAHVVLTVSDFTRRRLNVKMTKWFGQYAKGKRVDYILSRIDHRSMGVYTGDSSWVRLNRTR